ncbi:hypothetical protein CN918_29995 [Priestia megaterium]|nr:hypothetical protein CN918_29995 [Priestia megaterium]
MRDKRFVAKHRGGPLTIENHRGLIRWARECSIHVLPLIDEEIDVRLTHSLNVCKEWENGHVATGVAMKASVGAHAAARELTNPISVAVARSVGHAVATAHMADHSLGAALYGLKAINLAGKSVHDEKEWQISQLQHLPSDIVELVLINFKLKAKSFKI